MKDRSNDRQIRQVRSSGRRMIRQNDIATIERPFERSHLILNSFLHSSKMHGYVRGVRDKTTVRTKNGAGEIKTLFDVRRNRGSLKNP